MLDPDDVTPEAVLSFANTVLDLHSENEQGMCRKCRVISPCHVEHAAMLAGLVPAPPYSGELVRWLVAEDSQGNIVCETDWRRFGQGHIIIFQRSAVAVGKFPDTEDDTSLRRSAWAAACGYLARTRGVEHGPR